ncbi:MAG: hypothetical protein D3908_09145, partial [Candidatus Electrothrix sp. AUS4]|nr:hypothetical protein [Candidatus Electrothrix sp. AUS4]
NPFFTLEFLRQLKESGDVFFENGHWTHRAKVEWDKLPQNVEGIIEAKISKLSAELQALLTISSVEGCSFSGPLVARIEGLNDKELTALIVDKLIKTYSLVEEDQPQHLKDFGVLRRYKFINKMYQQYIYSKIPSTERMILHGRIAENLEELSREFGMCMDYQLAFHYSKAGNEKKAVKYFYSSAKNAIRVGAYKTALEYLEKAIASLPEEPPDEMINFACQVRVDLSMVLKVVNGWGDRTTHDAYRDCIQFAEKKGRQELILPVVHGIWGYHIFKNDIIKACTTSQRFLQLTLDSRNKVAQTQALLGMSNSYFWNGKIEESQKYLNEFYRKFDLSSMGADAIDKYGQNPLAIAYMFSALNYTHMGDFVSGLMYINKTLAFINEGCDKFSEAIALTTLTWVYSLMGKDDLSEKYADLLESLAKEYEITLYLVYAYLFKGIYQFRQGNCEEAARFFERSKEISDRMEQYIMSSVRTLMEFELLLAQGKYTEILERSNIWITKCNDCGEFAYLTEFYRYKGIGCYLAGDHTGATKAFIKAMDISKQNGILLFERRSAESYLEMLTDIGGNIDE